MRQGEGKRACDFFPASKLPVIALKQQSLDLTSQEFLLPLISFALVADVGGSLKSCISTLSSYPSPVGFTCIMINYIFDSSVD